jgi:hypothetical protein
MAEPSITDGEAMADEQVEDVSARDICPNCFSQLQPDEPVCPACGFDTAAGQGMPPSGVEQEETGKGETG